MLTKLIFIFLITIIQFIFFDIDSIFKIDLVVISIVYFAVKGGTMSGQLIGFTFGIIQDALYFSFLGLNMLALTIIGFISGQFKNKVNLENFLFQFIITFTFVLTKSLITYLIYQLVITKELISWLSILELFINALFNGILSFIIFFILNKKFKKI